jgi:transposase
MRCLTGRAPVSELFGVKGRRWLAALQLPFEERETVDGCMRQIEFLDAEIAAVEQLIATCALSSPQTRRLMSVPGVNVIVAASFLAAIGDIGRFENARRLVGYLGVDPRVRQSGSGPATHGRISKQGSVRARHALVEASWSTVRQPGPLHAFYQRIRARCGHQVAVVAAARKTRVPVLVPAHPRAGLRLRPAVADTQEAARRLELMAGAPSQKGIKSGIWAANHAMCQAERDLARQAATAYQRTVRDWHAAPKPRKRARARHRDAHLQGRLAASSAARHQSQTLRFSLEFAADGPEGLVGISVAVPEDVGAGGEAVDIGVTEEVSRLVSISPPLVRRV